jgi:transketolase
MKEFNQKYIEEQNKKIKINILDAAYTAGANSSHLGGALSLVDILGVLFHSVMNYNSQNYQDPARDRFILSKGHGCLVYYSILCNLGIISKKQLLEFEKNDSFLPGHPVKNLNYGIEFSTGSLGMGFSLGIGVALALKKMNKKSTNVYVVIGDGECNEGSIWEAAMSAPHFELNNLIVILDNNSYQQTGHNNEIMNTENLKKKFQSFNWNVIEIDGHNLKEIHNSFINKEENSRMPKIIICKTIKGKGVSFCENNNQWHHSILSKNLYEKALLEIKK